MDSKPNITQDEINRALSEYMGNPLRGLNPINSRLPIYFINCNCCGYMGVVSEDGLATWLTDDWRRNETFAVCPICCSKIFNYYSI
jgi:hypothetical protein